MVALVSPLWRWVVTDLTGASVTILDHLAADRVVTPKLNEALEVTASVPSDNSEINRLHTDNFPFLAEGVRLLYCFRRESDIAPYYTIRASTLIMQTTDAAGADDARTSFTAFDPWQYLLSRPILVPSVLTVSGYDVPPTANDAAITNLGSGNYFTYDKATYPTMGDVIYAMLSNSVSVNMSGLTIPASVQNDFIDFGPVPGNFGVYDGTWETLADTPNAGWLIEPGISVGQALQDICAAGFCDIWMEPIYDPINRPGILCQVNLFRQRANDGIHSIYGQGGYNWSAIFAWDMPGRSLVGINDNFDGTQRANYAQFYFGQGGPKADAWDVPASIEKYGEYWVQQFFTSTESREGVNSLAQEQLVLRKDFKQTLTVNPAPERSPEPFVDYFVGDAVPIYISANARQSEPPGYNPPTPTPDPNVYVWQRVYGIPVHIDDNGTETVSELIVGPIGAPPPVGEGAMGDGISGMGVAVAGAARGRTSVTLTRLPRVAK